MLKRAFKTTMELFGDDFFSSTVFTKKLHHGCLIGFYTLLRINNTARLTNKRIVKL